MNKHCGSLIILIILGLLIIGSTFMALITNPVETIIRLVMIGIMIVVAVKFVHFADNYADKHTK